ncbi:MAG: aconitate hydratase [Cellvibrionaceae bacterium]
MRHEDGLVCSSEDIEVLAFSAGRASIQEIVYHPARVLMKDFTGVPAIVDLAAMPWLNKVSTRKKLIHYPGST